MTKIHSSKSTADIECDRPVTGRRLELSISGFQRATQIDVGLLGATMLFPYDSERQIRYACAHLARYLRGLGGRSRAGELREAIDRIERRTVPYEELVPVIRKAFVNGYTVGALFRQALAKSYANKHHYANLGRAIKWLHDGVAYPAKEVTKSTRYMRPASQHIHNTLLKNYRCVGHLWAASYAQRELGSQVWPCTPQGLTHFLALSEEFRRCAESVRTSRRLLLIPGEAIRPPADLVLPKLEVTNIVVR